MAGLDIRTLFLSGAVVALLMGAIVLAFGRQGGTRGEGHLRSWGWSLLALTTGFILFGLQQSLDPTVATIAGNTLINTAAVLLLRSARLLRGLGRPSWIPWLAVPTAAAVSVAGTIVWNAYPIRSAICTGLVSGLMFRAAWLVGHRAPPDTRAAHHIAAFTIAAYAALLAARSTFTLLRGPAPGIIQQPGALDVLTLLGFQAFAVSATLGLMWIEIQGLQGDLERLATHDSLTGIFNRGAFFGHFEREVSRCRRTREPFALAVFDLDHFKRLNDTHGHPFGDKVLQQAAQCLQADVRIHDVLGRYGGEEFALLMPGLDKTGGLRAAERARAGLEALAFDRGGTTVQVTVSAGVAAFPGDGADSAALLAAADSALYEAKASGRNRVVAAG
jgi:diguanylate cyclase (GGDEF)-like protein